MDLIQSARQSIDIGSFYWDLRQVDGQFNSRRQRQHKHKSSSPYSEGERIFKELAKAGLQRKLKVRIAQSQAGQFPDNDTAVLEKMGS